MIKIKRPVFLYPIRMAVQLRRPTCCRGQTLVEYALILAVISIVAIGVMVSMGQQVKSVYSTINSTIASSQGSH